jgi:uncharacterized membrane protein YfcA
VLAALFGTISLLYATVGQAGGTAFLALMAFAAFPSTEMRATALALNVVAAAYSTWVFNREKVVDWRKLRLLLLSSLPTALVGGFIVLDEHVYKSTTGVVLLLAAPRRSCVVTVPPLRNGRPRAWAPWVWGPSSD